MAVKALISVVKALISAFLNGINLVGTIVFVSSLFNRFSIFSTAFNRFFIHRAADLDSIPRKKKVAFDGCYSS